MSFDWRSFATGFLERQQEITKERREEAKTFEEEQRAAAERNAQTISRRRAITDRVTGYATYLQSNGVTEDQLQAVIASGPEAIATLTERVQAAVEANGGRPLGESDAATLIRMPEGFSPVDMSMDQFIRQTYGLAAPAREEAPAEELTFLQRISGMGEMARAEERLTRTPFAEGMTILDINRAAQGAEYQSLIPGTFVTFATDNRYDVTEEGVDFLRDFSNQIDMLSDSSNYRAVVTELGMEAGQEAQLQMRIETVDPLIRGYARNDPEGFMQAHEAQIRNQLGDAYVQQLREDLGLDAPEPEEGEQPVTSPTATPAPTAGGTDSGVEQEVVVETGAEDAVTTAAETSAEQAEPVVIPSVPRSELITLSVGDADMPAPPMNATVRIAENDEDEGKIFTYQQWLDMSQRERRTAGLPVNLTRANAFFTEYGVDPTTGAPFEMTEPDPETQVETDSGETITYQQWLEMSRSARKAAGLPENLISGQMYFNRFGVGLGINDPETGQSIFAQTPESRDTQQSEAYRALSAQGVDDISINLLETRGPDMVRYLRAQGATDPEAAFNALTEWGQQNNIVMPFDKSALIFALMQDINR